MNAPKKLDRITNNNMGNRGRTIARISPRSELKYFCRVVMARRYSDAVPAIADLTARLLRRGQSPVQIAHDLSQLARVGGFGDAVAPVVHELTLAVRGVANEQA
ncbi:hypothetical protein [Burkholderia gladioli]|uniref:hypothetical protein n=1 Tax=Burkholderia gladioli TaxID=28095 RepID=UPI001640BB8F|nr:hypothetical protein [Burkholderia gladioli]